MKKYLVVFFVLALALMLSSCEGKEEAGFSDDYQNACFDIGGLMGEDGCISDCDCDCSPVKEVEEKSSNISCVIRIYPGDEAEFFTETWDSETRVWIHAEGGTCQGPYCYSFDNCDNPEITVRRQPFWTGHELSPVTGQPFQICYNFEGSCAR
jgi:hypothetical protein